MKQLKDAHECLLIRVIRDDEGFHVEAITHYTERGFTVANSEDVIRNLKSDIREIDDAFRNPRPEDRITTNHVGRA